MPAHRLPSIRALGRGSTRAKAVSEMTSRCPSSLPGAARALALLGLVLAACGGSSSLPGTDDPGDADGGCIDECPGTYACMDGALYAYSADATRCSCVAHEFAGCARGCRSDGISRIHAGSSEGAAVLCEENRPKHVGDPCSAPDWCQPEVAVVDYDAHTLQNVYLQCDVAQQLCVARAAPVISDWMATCGLGDDAPVDIGAFAAPGCSSGICYTHRHDGCLHQGCIAGCASDGECPEGTVCTQGSCLPPPWIDLDALLMCPAP
jgi:hypothetical protein